MRFFILKILKVFLLVLVQMSIIQLLVSWRINGISTTGQDNWEQTKSRQAELVFLGNSRCIGSIIPGLFTKKTGVTSINLGANGQDNFLFFKRRLERFVINGNKFPKYVVIVCEPINSTNKQFEQKDRFARYAFNPSSLNYPLLEYFEFDFLDYYIPSVALLRYRRIIDCLLLTNKSTYEKLGYSMFTGSLCGQKIQEFDTNLVHRDQTVYHKQLVKFKNWVTKNNSKLIGVQLPMLGMRKLESSIKKNQTLLQKNNIPFINVFKECLNNCNYFSDRFHPNENGAKIITIEISKEFKKIVK